LQSSKPRFAPNGTQLKFGSLAFLILLLMSALAVGVASGEEGTEAETASVGEPVGAPVRELPDRRTATSRTFELSNGQFETRLFEVPVNYRDENGDWKPISEELTQLPGGAVTNRANSFDVHLPTDLDQAPVRIDFGDGRWISQRPLGLSTQPVDLAGEVATYEPAGSNAGVEFTGLATGLKENIVLAGPSAPSTYRYALDLSGGISPELTEGGAIEFRDSEGATVGYMPPPVMADSAAEPQVSNAIHYAIEPKDSGGWLLSVEADSEWLSDPARVFPVKLDPTWEKTVPAPALDCIIATTTEGQMCGTTGNSYLTAKANYPTSTGPSQLARTLLRFDTSAIPKTAFLTSATIGLYSAKTATNITKVDMYDISRSWASSATWTKYEGPGGTKLWKTAGGEFGKYMPTPTSLTPAERGGSGPGSWNFSSPELTWLTQRWLDGIIPNNGVLLKLADEAPYACCFERRVEWESSSATNKPYLSVQYIEPAPTDSKITSPSDGTKTAKRFLLTSAWEHPGVTGVSFQYKTDQGWKDIPGGQVIDQNNQTVAWPISVSKLDRESKPLYWDATAVTGNLAAKKLQIRAMLSGDPGTDGYTKPISAEVNRHIGGSKDGTAPIGPGSVDLMTGNFTVSRTDISIPAFKSSLEFSRSFSSREATVEPTGVLGPGWKPTSPLEEAGGSAWTKLVLKEETEVEEEGTTVYKWAELTHAEGDVIPFEDNGSGYVTPPEMTGYVLYRNPSSGNIEFTDPAGNKTVFSNGGSGNEYLPVSVAMTGSSGNNKARMIYEVVGGKRRLWKIIAPTAPGLSCPDEGSSIVNGCRLLVFNYAYPPGAPESVGKRLLSTTYYASGHGGPWTVAEYSYDSQGRMIAAWDPRISPNLKETYTYNATGQIATLTPPGQEAWTMAYGTLPGGTAIGRLTSVKRPSLVEGKTAQTTVAYEVPLSKAGGGAYDMQGSDVATWGQKDLPTDATAIFSPDEVPSAPPSSFAKATVYYMDAEGQVSNVATPSGAGTSEPSITTTETDQFGNVTRELSAQNRLRALAKGTESAATSENLDTQFRYSKDGTELQEEEGPMHEVKLESGAVDQARTLRTIQYDANLKYINGTTTPSPGETKPHFPTSETTGALLSNEEKEETVDKRTTQYVYNWTLRMPIETISNPGGGSEEVKSVTAYDEKTGLTTEVRQPKNAGGGGAGTTKIVYYTYKQGLGHGNCESELFAGLPCKIEPAAQPGTAGLPQLPVKKFLSYNQLSELLEMTESPGGGAENVRKAVTTYDAAGRQKTSQISGGGVAVPKTETLYSSTLGAPTTQRFVCSESEPGCDTQANTTTYDSLGRAIKFQDADGVTAETTFDLLGRPATVSDGKGTQTMKYDAATGLLVELEDSAAGKFTAAYDADGQLVKRGLPNGLTAETTYDETGAAVALGYTKASNCGLSCNWLNFAVERSINGQILLENGTLGKDEYAYDKVGRLISARETPIGGSCTTRTYKYDKDSNREELTTTPGTLGACSSSGGTTQKYSYDTADRLLGEGIAYDDFGRITSLPAVFAGGKTLSTTYFSNDMVATQTQNGVTNSFQLDSMLRQRQRLQAGGLEGTEVFHYAGPGDSPTWTQRGSTWTRSIVGIGGELAAIQESGKEVQLQLTNLHGDVSAVAALNPAVTELKGTFQFDEFGNPTGGSAGRFGWLGGKQRRTELASGVIQMGARSYAPSLGRFLTPDPILGGAANPYDYANQDPVNAFDLAGTCSTKKGCRHVRKARRNQAEGRVENIRERMQKAREKRAGARASGVGVAGPGMSKFPKLEWEKEAGKALNFIEKNIAKLLDMSCGEASEHLFAAAGAAGGAAFFLAKGGPAAVAVGGMLAVLSAGAAIGGGVLYGSSKAGVC
jgi:RHS repeat-associated protein